MNIKIFHYIPLIIDLFKLKIVNNVVILHCDKPENMVLVQKIFSNHDIVTSTLSLQKLYIIPTTDDKRIGILLDGLCKDWPNVLAQTNNSVWFQNQFCWLMISNDISLVSRMLSKLPIYINSDFSILLKNGNIINIFELYNSGYDSKVIINMVGYWDTNLHHKMIKRSLNGVTIRSPVVVVEKIVNETFEEYLTNKKPHVDSLHKLKFYILLQYLRDMYNISYELIRVNSWGYIRNGTFDGIVGVLQKQEADLGGSPLFFRADRAQLVDYIVETWPSRQCFILRHPKHPGGFYTIYTRPLTARVWYCILGMLGLSAVMLSLMMKLKTVKVGNDADSSATLMFLFTWSANCQQGMTIIDRNSTSVKIVIFVTFIYSLTLYQYYNAAVVSTLLREPPTNIKTLEDLLKSNLKAGAEDVLYTKDYFKRTTDPIAIQIYNKKIVDNHYNYLSPEHGMALVKTGGFAFHVDSVVAYRIMRRKFSEREICDVQEIPLYPPQKMGVVVRKQSPYKEHITFGIRKMYEAGLMHRLKSAMDEPKPPCVRTPDSSIISVSLREFSTALIVLSAGTIAAVLILIGEILLFKMKRHKY